MNMKNPSIQVQLTVGTQISYLDAHIKFITDDDDDSIRILDTSVNHESNVEPYGLPYIYDQPSNLSHSKLIRVALIRAALCCSNIYEFQDERQYIELSFSLNHFPFEFINQHVTMFFFEFDTEEFDYHMYDQNIYQEFRQNVIKYDRKRIQKKFEHQKDDDYLLNTK